MTPHRSDGASVLFYALQTLYGGRTGTTSLIYLSARSGARQSSERVLMSESFAEPGFKEPSFQEMFEASLAGGQSMQPGTIVNAIVLEVKPDVVIVDAGLKSEGVIPLIEFMVDGEIRVAVGDHVEVALETVEDGFGETKFSKEKAERIKTWDRLNKAFEGKETVIGIMTGKVKGGFTVDIGTVRAFLPGSLVDVRPVRDTSYLEGKPLEFKVIKLDRLRNNVVVSRREVLEAEYSAERDSLLQNLQEGVVLRGVVKNLVEYGAFVDLGGIDGLLHITDMTWKRIKDPSEVVQVGTEIEVKVLKYDRERRRVSLGLKQLGADPWVDIARRYPEKTRMFGKVTNITDYGSFVEIEPGVEGLVHVSEMDWTNKNINPGKAVVIGQEVEVMILDIDEERRRISLGMKQCVPNPWEEFAQNYQKGDKVSGQIKSITDFGIFIGLNGGIDGLVHLSDLDWNDDGANAVRRFSKGMDVDAVVLAIDAARERISLGVKQVAQDPLTQFMAETQKGSIVKGTIRTVEARGAVIDLGNGVEAYIKANDLSRERVEDARTVLKEGDALEARFIGVDRKNRIVSLSVREKEIQEEAEILTEYSRNASTGRTSLGDILKQKIGGGPDGT
ncbi:MAG: 30S ribosomal protein S1 [Panacagrimonas sp.]